MTGGDWKADTRMYELTLTEADIEDLCRGVVNAPTQNLAIHIRLAMARTPSESMWWAREKRTAQRERQDG
jgi:hypothetical protein